MTKDTFQDLTLLHRYLEEITNFIEAIVQQENVAIMLACQVFDEHKKEAAKTTFPSEEKRLIWLKLRARYHAGLYLKQKFKPQKNVLSP